MNLVLQSSRPGASQDVTTGAASAQSTAFGTNTSRVRLCTTVSCRILFGTNPTALAASPLLPANSVEFFEVLPGEKVAAIQEGSAGKLNIVEMG
jgi:hypothetical protein